MRRVARADRDRFRRRGTGTFAPVLFASSSHMRLLRHVIDQKARLRAVKESVLEAKKVAFDTLGRALLAPVAFFLGRA